MEGLCKECNDDFIKLLRRKNHKKNKDYTLWKIVKRGHVHCLMIRIGAGANVNSDGQYGTTPLTLAAGKGDYVCTEALLEAGADVNHEKSRNALETVATHSSGRNIFDLLIKAGADVNIVNGSGYPLITLVAMYVRPGYIDSLIKAGADVNAIDVYGTVDSRHLTDDLGRKIPIPDFLLNEDLKLCLNHMCREAIRKHLLQMSNLNLFCRIPRLVLPHNLREYLMYYVSIDDVVKPVYGEKSGLIVANH